MEASMFNETYVREYLSVVAEKPEKYYKDYLRLVDRVNRSRAIYKGQPFRDVSGDVLRRRTQERI